MSVYNHRTMVPNNQTRLLELLDAVKVEYDQLYQDAQVFKNQRDEYEHKVNSQIQEMNIFQQNLIDLERTQQLLKKQYEEEIARLRQQLDHPNYQQDVKPSTAPPPPPLLSSGSPLTSVPHFGPPPNQPPNQHPPQHRPPPPPSQHRPSQHQPPQHQPPQHQPPQHQPPQHQPPQHQPPQHQPPQHQPPQHQPPQHQPPQPPQQHQPPPHRPPQQQPPPQHLTRPINKPPPPSPANPSSQVNLSDIDPDTLPANMKTEGYDWFALFNPKIPKSIKVDLVHNFDHNSVVCCVKFSLDGRYIAAGCNQSTYIYDTNTSQRVAVLQDDSGNRSGDLYIRSISFSPDGKYLATGAEDRKIRIWDIANARIQVVLPGHEQEIYSLEFSRDGRFLVSGSGDRTTRVWDWKEGKCLHVLRVPEIESIDSGVTSIAISPNSQFIATGSLDRVVRIWDALKGTLLEKLEGHRDSVYSVAFMSDGTSLISGSLDKKIKLWQLMDRTKYVCTQTFTGHKDFVLSVATTPDDRWVISGSKDRNVQFWDPRTGQPQVLLQGHKNSVISVAASLGRRPLFATGSGDNRVRVWSYEPVS